MQKIPVGRTLVIAGLVALIPLIGNVVASFLTTWTGTLSWLVAPTVAVVVGMVTTLIQAMSSATSPRSQTPTAAAGPDPVTEIPHYARKRSGISLPIAIVIVLLVIGVGGFGVTLGVRYVVGYITGNESGTEHLVRPATGTAAGLTLTVESVIYTDHFTRVEVAARNDTGVSLTLPLFTNCVMVGRDGTTLEADPFRSRWSDTVAPGGVQRGTITFQSQLPVSVRRARFGFTTVFAMGFEGPDNIFVGGIRLRRGSTD